MAELIHILGDGPLARELAYYCQRGNIEAGLAGPHEEDQLPAWAQCVIGVGDPKLKRKLADKFYRLMNWPTLDFGAGGAWELGPGAVVAPGCRGTLNISIGAHSYLNLNCTVGHDVKIGRFCQINPGVNISGGVQIDDGVLIGANVSIREGVRIGEGATVGMGSVVLRDVAPGVTVAGVPAKEL